MTYEVDLGEFDPADAVRHLRRMGHGCVCSVIADQIEAQAKPPRIPEPGLWGVVEAATNDEPSKRKAFVRYPDEGWCADSVSAYEWRLLVDPVLIRDGIEEF